MKNSIKTLVNIYLRNSDIIIVPNAYNGITFFETEPILTMNIDSRKISIELKNALKISAHNLGFMKFKGDGEYISPVLQYLKFKSRKQFFKNIALCKVYIDNDFNTNIQPYTPYKKGGAFLAKGNPIALGESEEIGDIVLNVLKSCKRLNPSKEQNIQ